jgi:hypothetical protein
MRCGERQRLFVERRKFCDCVGYLSVSKLKPVQIKAEYNQSLEMAEPLECGSPLPLW